MLVSSSVPPLCKGMMWSGTVAAVILPLAWQCLHRGSALSLRCRCATARLPLRRSVRSGSGGVVWRLALDALGLWSEGRVGMAILVRGRTARLRDSVQQPGASRSARESVSTIRSRRLTLPA